MKRTNFIVVIDSSENIDAREIVDNIHGGDYINEKELSEDIAKSGCKDGFQLFSIDEFVDEVNEEEINLNNSFIAHVNILN